MTKKPEESKEMREKMFEMVRSLPQYSRMKSALSPLVENLEDESSAAYLFIKRNCVAVQASIKRTHETLRLIRELLASISSEITNRRILSLLSLYSYLAVVESSATTLIDIILLLLIAEGHDLHIERRFVRHVSNSEDLVKVELWTKLEFLKEHGLKPVYKVFDRKFRNQIAHLDFTIDDKGMIKIGARVLGVRDVIEKLDSLLDNVSVIFCVLIDLGFDKIVDRMIES